MKSWSDYNIRSIHTLTGPELLLFRESYNALSNAQKAHLSFIWPLWARPEQLPPTEHWTKWVLQAGRAFGKTRALAETIRDYAEKNPGIRIALCGRTEEEVLKVFVFGTSSLVSLSPRDRTPVYHVKNKTLRYPNGSAIFLHSAAEPEKFRGPEYHIAGLDELASYKLPALWDNMLLSVRLRDFGSPKVIIATTPKTTPIFKRVLEGQNVIVTRGSTIHNEANLHSSYISDLEKRYGGTRFYRQEILGELMGEPENSLWSLEWIETARVERPTDIRDISNKLDKIVIAVDPAVSTTKRSNITGIVVAGKLGEQFYVLEDASMPGTPKQWSSAVARLYHKYEANCVICEVNNGGDLVVETIRSTDETINVKKVFATKGKVVRAEPVSALYEQSKVSHVGEFPQMEEQLCSYEAGGTSPDRLDALVWSILELMQSTRRNIAAKGIHFTDELIQKALQTDY